MGIGTTVMGKVIGTFYDDIVKYYGLYGFVKYKWKAIQNKPITISAVDQFWSMILKDKFNGEFYGGPKVISGQPINFTSNFYLSEWAPKIPGKIWTQSGQLAFNQAFSHQITDEDWKWKKKYEVIFDEYGKRKAIEAGFGSVRINPSNNPSEAFMYMSLTTPDHWDIDSGIPVVVAKSVYEEYRRKSENYGAVEIGKLEGFLIIDYDLPIRNIISNAIGAKLNDESRDILQRSINHPKCFIYIPSTLCVNFKYNNSHPECCGWTIYKKKVVEDWRKNYGQKSDFEYGFTYNCFYPTHPETIEEAVEFMKDYALYNEGTEIITDFDGIEARFESILNLQSNPEETQANLFKKTLNDLSQWVSSIELKK